MTDRIDPDPARTHPDTVGLPASSGAIVNGGTHSSSPNGASVEAANGAAWDRAVSPSPGVPAPERTRDAARRAATDAIPLMDPRRIYAEWGPQAERKLTDILRSHTYVKGANVERFEQEFAAYTGVREAVAVDSCTDALYLVLRAVLHERPADAREVILPTFTFVATAGAVVNAGGVPVFADVDIETHNIDPQSVASQITERTAAVIPVHIFGAPADIAGIHDAIAPYRSNGDPRGRREIFVLEDAAQAIHSTIEGRRAGSLADAGTFSFYPSKNLAAAGDGGIVTTDDAELANHVRALRDHGQTRKLYDHTHVGTNSRMDEMQAAILRLKLPHIGAWTEQRQAIAARYDAAFEGTPVLSQRVLPGTTSAYHLYTVRVRNREEVRAALQAADIGCGVYYPQPLHRQTCFSPNGYPPCPHADALSETVLSLPCFPGLRAAEQDRVIDVVLAAARS